MFLGLGLPLTAFGSRGGVADVPDNASLASQLLAAWADSNGGWVLDFRDASASVNDPGTPANTFAGSINDKVSRSSGSAFAANDVGELFSGSRVGVFALNQGPSLVSAYTMFVEVVVATPTANAIFVEGQSTAGATFSLTGAATPARLLQRNGASNRGDASGGPAVTTGTRLKMAVGGSGSGSVFAVNGSTLTSAATPGQGNFATNLVIGGRSSDLVTITLQANSRVVRVMGLPRLLTQPDANTLTTL